MSKKIHFAQNFEEHVLVSAAKPKVASEASVFQDTESNIMFLSRYIFRLIFTCVIFFFCLSGFCQTEKAELDRILSLVSSGNLHLQTGNFESAEKFYLEAKNIWEKVLGTEHPEYAKNILRRLGLLYRNIGDYVKSEKYFLEAKSIQEKKLGKEHPDYVSTLNNLGFVYRNLGDYDQAEKYYLEAKVIQEKILNQDHPDYVSTLINLGNTYLILGKYNQAEKYYLEAKVIQEKILNQDHPDFVSTLDNLGFVYLNLDDYNQAEKYYLEVKTIREKTLGKDHPGYAASLNNLGILYDLIGNYTQAEKYYLELITIREIVLGKDHLEYAQSLHDLGCLYRRMGDYIQAEKYLIEAKTIRGNVLVKENPDYANSLKDLGFLYYIIGDYNQAEKYYLEFLAICEKVLGVEHTDYSSSLNFLGLTYLNLGDYINAEKYLIEEKSITEKVLGKEHPDYAISLNNLGSLYKSIGDYNQSEKNHIEAKTIQEIVLGKEHPDYATSLNNLGGLYLALQDYSRSEKYLIEAKSIKEKVFGKEHPEYATSLNNLGLLYKNMKNYSLSEDYFLEAKNIIQKKLDKEHPHYSTLLDNLGILFCRIGDYSQAEKYLLESRSIREKILSKEHPDYATSLNNLGTLYIQMGDYAKAEKYLIEAKSIKEKVIEKHHPDFETLLGNMSVLYLNLQENEKTALFIKETCSISTELIIKNFTFLSEQQRMNYWNNNRGGFILSYALSDLYPVPEVHSLNYDNALFTKAILLRTTNNIRNAIYSSGNPDLIEQYVKMRNIRQQIMALQANTEKSRLDYIQSLEKEADELDKALTVSSVAYRDLNADLNLKWKDIRDNLSENEVAIEFIDYQVYDRTWSDTTRYAALLLRSDSEAPVFVPLFEEQQLNILFEDDNPVLNARISKLYNGSNPRLFNGQKLYQLIWQPLEQFLQGIETVYYSPSGVLNKIAFSAIPFDTVCLMDRYDLHLVSSTREIVHKKKREESLLPVKQSILYGGIQYDVSDPQELQTAALPYQETVATLFASRSLSEDSDRSSWVFLQGTESEVVAIDEILQRPRIPNITYMRVAANEESFKAFSGNSPALLHIATHGFFLQDEKEIRQTGFMQMMGENRVVRNPLLRSGLLFAGANRAWTNTDVIPDIEDGVLTAEEIAQLDLTNTKLVVLSACETGLGEVQNSEGVFGLQRAFKLAGVETLVMSLWKVDDTATKDFMISFYQNLIDGKSKIQSFKNAQNLVREKYRTPYYWAGFVMLD